ncbi:L-glutamate gamma-semialdehyde dehydrogenase [candidate division TA06 bacterium B3_TA06]|uniref:L-glutamate gamma-semialdehyde dehydrogenase n=1 Tax=candidate division TA06 bacterium B3_TA06 TaxID=2012487 RepID=A0A532V7E0_UNCT6|nr:MAG: L-glutamate gamma-semialdehyde dehydrogenase [candidate division TA06 bacterium B3_TA06]
MVLPFKNEPYKNFSCEPCKKAQLEAIAALEKNYGKTYPAFIGGKEVAASETFASINPADKDKVIGLFQKADEKLAEQALQAALAAFEWWRFYDFRERANILLKAAHIARRRRFEINAGMILEEGKNWIEADVDTAEGIDFLEFYGREMLRLGPNQPVTPFLGENNELRYIPLGVGIIIPPWNFPWAILVGMSSAAIVTGNTIVLKPSSDSPYIGWLFTEIMREAGLPDGVLNYLSGPGAIAGEYLVKHPKTRFISFTGSKEVGLRIVENAAKKQEGQIWIKRVVAEMGGKDCILVDEEADLDAAVEGVAVSAYGFGGQKCSACSRAIIDEKVYDEFVKKLIPRIKEITVGETKDTANWMGPVINEKALKNTLAYIEIGKKEGELLCGGNVVEGNGFFLEPTVFGNVAWDARIAQEEIFAPVLAIVKCKDFDDGLRIVNSTEYGLTGSVYTNNRCKIAKAKRLFHVGNMYINRKCTGALVDVQPFGGFNMSGTDSKAGGRDYLLLFMQGKSIAERF